MKRFLAVASLVLALAGAAFAAQVRQTFSTPGVV